MKLSEKLNDDYKVALKAGDKARVETLRLLRSQLKDVAIAKQGEATAEEEMAVLANAAKKRRESIKAYRDAGRSDLLEKEAAELTIISTYLPEQLSDDKLNEIVNIVIQETGASGPKDMGKVMGKIMPRVKGQADGNLIKQFVQDKLTS